MDFIWRRSRTLGAMALVLTIAGISIAVARPHSFINPDLGAEWQCSRTLFVLTCTHSSNETKAGFLDETKATTSGRDISKPLYTSFIPSHDLCLRSRN